MSGTKEGAKKSVAKIKELYGEDFFKIIGHDGGVTSHFKNENGKALKGFALDKERARISGMKGGKHSTREGIKNGEGKKR